MSFILDALRKSEHERQINAGHNTGLMYKVEIKHNHYPWLIPAIIALVVIIALALIWRMWPRTYVADSSNSINPQEIVSASKPQSISQERTILKPTKHNSDPAQKKIPIVASVESKPQQTIKTETTAHSSPGTVTTVEKPPVNDPLTGMPPLTITGYVHNEQSGSLAMINNQVVHEGEEVSPGLRLIKILDDSAIFSYKGFVFTR